LGSAYSTTIGIFPAERAAFTYDDVRDAEADAFVPCVIQIACGVCAIRDRIAAARESPPLAFTHAAPPVFGSTYNSPVDWFVVVVVVGGVVVVVNRVVVVVVVGRVVVVVGLVVVVTGVDSPNSSP
jgi:hypothetical protein